LGVGGIGGFPLDVAVEESPELGEQVDEEILASEIGDDALLDLAVLAVGFDDADVFVDGAVLRADFDGSGIHGWLLALLAGNVRECTATIITTDYGEIKRLMGN
jgi:hypothetical protein